MLTFVAVTVKTKTKIELNIQYMDWNPSYIRTREILKPQHKQALSFQIISVVIVLADGTKNKCVTY